MRNVKAIVILLVALLAGSCEKIIDINIPDKSRKIVLNSIIDPENIFTMHLTQSKSILEDNIVLILEGAEVKVYEGGSFIGNMDYLGHDAYYLPGFYPAIGKKYRVEVAHSVLETVEAEVVVPEPISIIEVDTSSSISEWGQKLYNLNFTFNNHTDEISYYAVSIGLTIHIYDWENQIFLDSTETYNTYFSTSRETNSGIGENLMDNDLSFFIDDKLFFSDEMFIGQDGVKELALEYYVYSPGDSVMVDVRLDHIAPSYYYYSVSKEKYYRADGNPFAEPVQVYNNVHNGFGLLSSFSRTHKTFTIFVDDEKY